MSITKGNNRVLLVEADDSIQRIIAYHLKKAGFHDFTYAYAINESAAKKLIEMQTPIQYIADNLLAHASTKGLIEAYTAWPKVFLHDEGPGGQARPSYIR